MDATPKSLPDGNGGRMLGEVGLEEAEEVGAADPRVTAKRSGQSGKVVHPIARRKMAGETNAVEVDEKGFEAGGCFAGHEVVGFEVTVRNVPSVHASQ